MPSSLRLSISSFWFTLREVQLFHLNTSGHCRVINWPNFNIVVSQGLGRCKYRERDPGMVGLSRSQNTHTCGWHLLSLHTGVVCGTPNNCRHNIKEHWPQITVRSIIVMKTSEIIVRITKMGQWHEGSHAVGKWHWWTCLMQGVHRPSIWGKKHSICEVY